MKIGLIIQKLRTDANMTQEELAGNLFVSRELVSKWENNTRRPDYSTIKKIAELFNVDVNVFINPGNKILEELHECFEVEGDYNNMAFANSLNAFLKTIPRLDCMIFVHRYYSFESTKEIGTLLGMKDGTVRSSLSRTRKRLKKYLSEENNNE